MSARILVAEDDAKQARLIRIYLEQAGDEVQIVSDGRSAIDRARSSRPDLLVLDVMMPNVDGLDVCRILRAESQVPILLLTARSTEEDLLLGLDLGADDYLTKPYSPRELTARVRALLRRSKAAAPAAPAVLTVGALEVDTTRFEVRAAGRPVALTGKEFAILTVLMGEPERVFTRAQIIDRVFGFDRNVLPRTVDAHVMNLRRKLEKGDGGTHYVETVYGRGYRLEQGTQGTQGTQGAGTHDAGTPGTGTHGAGTVR
ncbi:response regulator transcription factor [Streptomyces poriferorum]|uniref:Response regulator transcription factor n=1 Tax=Streptomyces poriferorum TaxID=2798799 RepID=A0ABY9IU59_9ACTN|nr:MULTISPECIES: response regulator transcription factor [unclassified Streptomyces]MDP5313439.1 response regulator transcription factor [Streptomyces sp. Alt4]WLQ57583.1 response regulator transcription factor [Streptomyces sp. Alt2]